MIDACVGAGAHYADLTGEIPFVREIVDEFDVAAAEAGVKIVQVCGFEALPPDLAVQLAAEAAREQGAELAELDLTVSIVAQPPGIPRASDLISGGTFQSMAEAVGSTDPSVLTDPAALIADPLTADAVRARSPIGLLPRRGRGGAAIGPMTPAAFINPAVIHRTAAIAAAERGVALEPFRYREGVAIAGSPLTLPLRMGAAAALSTTQLGVRAAARARPAVRARVAAGLRRALPDSGFGPAADRLEQWRWRVLADGRTGAGDSVGGHRRRRGPPGLPGDGADARRGRPDDGRARPDARPRRLPHPRPRPWDRSPGPLRPGPPALQRRLSRRRVRRGKRRAGDDSCGC